MEYPSPLAGGSGPSLRYGMKLITYNNRGIALVESIIAISVITIGVVAMLSLISRSLSLNRVVTDRYVAANLAAEGIELTKNLISHNLLTGEAWNKGFSTSQGEYEIDYRGVALQPWSDRFLKFDGTTYQYADGNLTTYKRRIVVEPIGSPIDEMRVNAIVSWTSRGNANFSVNLEDHFFNWRQP